MGCSSCARAAAARKAKYDTYRKARKIIPAKTVPKAEPPAPEQNVTIVKQPEVKPVEQPVVRLVEQPPVIIPKLVKVPKKKGGAKKIIKESKKIARQQIVIPSTPIINPTAMGVTIKEIPPETEQMKKLRKMAEEAKQKRIKKAMKHAKKVKEAKKKSKKSKK